MEISAYDIHHIASKYLNLRQHVYIVSDWLVFFCSFLCCQCGEYLARDVPMDGLSETSSVMYQITPRKFEVNAVQSNEDLIPSHIEEDVTESTSSILKGSEPWSLVDSPRELDGKVQHKNFEPTLIILTDNPCPDKEHSPGANRTEDYPTVHCHKKIQEQHEMNVV